MWVMESDWVTKNTIDLLKMVSVSWNTGASAKAAVIMLSAQLVSVLAYFKNELRANEGGNLAIMNCWDF